MTSTVISTDGKPIAYTVDHALASWQQPKATLLMHHGVGFNRDAWRLWLPKLLSEGYKVIRVDMRGHGQSFRPEPGYEWKTEQFCADLNSVLDAENISETHFVGESWGGTIGLAWAALSPERAQTISLMSTTYDGSLVPMIAGFAEMIMAEGMDKWSRTMNEARFFPDVDPHIVKWAHDAQVDCTPHIIGDIFNYILGQSVESLLPKIEIPVLIMAPQSSPFVNSSLAVSLRDKLKNCELATFPGHRHGLVLSGGPIASHTLVNFIARRS